MESFFKHSRLLLPYLLFEIQQYVYSNNSKHYNYYTNEMYFTDVLSWSVSPNSFCIENYINKKTVKDSNIVILSISDLYSLGKRVQVTKEFIFYLRLSRILYINKYGYKYCEFKETFNRARPPQWSKWNAVRMVSTLHNVQHIIWIDIDAMFHSKSVSINSSFFANYFNNKLLVFTHSLKNKGANCGIFMANNININSSYALNLLDILDLFEFIIQNQTIIPYLPPYEQQILDYADYYEYNQTFDKYTILIPLSRKIQLFHGITNKNNDYTYFIWHWTGDNERYTKMISVLKREIKLFIKQTNKQALNFDGYYRQFGLNEPILNNQQRKYEPKWMKLSLICESQWWPPDKAIRIVGKVYDREEIADMCSRGRLKKQIRKGVS